MVASLNEKTGLHTQFVDAVAINDAAFFEAPIIFMEPIPGSMLKIKNANPWLQGQRAQGAHDYTSKKMQRLREYVLNRGGFIYMATHGNTEKAMYPAYRVLRRILPEYQPTSIPNNHEIYNIYYPLNGPLRFPIRQVFSATLHFGQYTELRGIFIDGRLAVLIDTEAMMHVIDGAVQKPFSGNWTDRNEIFAQFGPHAARQMTNIIVYAITHGRISDYSDYVPETALNDSGGEGPPEDVPPAIPKL